MDGGNPPKSGTLVIEVFVIDVNDNAPVFSQPLYNTRLSENAALGTSVIKIAATCCDRSVNTKELFKLTKMMEKYL